MSDEVRLVIFFILATQHIFHSHSKSLPTENNQNVDERKSPVTSYYRHNIFGPNTYAFGFEVNDKITGNKQFRDERHYANSTTQGSYGYLRPDGSVMITHFLADSEQGYSSQSRSFEPGFEPNWQINWPNKKPNNQSEKPLESTKTTSFNDDEVKLNLTSILLPVQAIKEENGIDLNPPELEKELVNPAVLEVINGEAPLISLSNGKEDSIGVETINKFIPSNFPLVPFELPHEDFKLNLTEGLGAKPFPVPNKSNIRNVPDSFPNGKLKDYQKNKVIKMSEKREDNLNNSTRVQSIYNDKNSDWCDKIIKKARKEYLEAVY